MLDIVIDTITIFIYLLINKDIIYNYNDIVFIILCLLIIILLYYLLDIITIYNYILLLLLVILIGIVEVIMTYLYCNTINLSNVDYIEYYQ